MDDIQHDGIKTAMEIGNLAAQLSPKDQAYVLNTINTMQFCKKTEREKQQQKEARKLTDDCSIKDG